MSDTKKAQLAKDRAIAAAKAKHGVAGDLQVAGTGPFGLPGAVSVFGVAVPSLLVLAVAAIVVVTGAALVVHFVRKG